MRRRTGFTLVEMMVSMALVIFIMVILSQAFVAGLESFRLLKATGDMQERLRTVSSVLRRDLASNHFGIGDNPHSLSVQTSGTWAPPASGFFRIWHGSAPSMTVGANYFDEGPDGDGIHSFRAVDHMLHFTITSSANRRENYVSATVPPGTPAGAAIDSFGPADFQSLGLYNTRWAQVAYFLRPNGSSANGTILYGLYRRQWAVIEKPGNVATLNGLSPRVPLAAAFNAQFHDSSFYDISCKSDFASLPPSPNQYLYFEGPADVTIPQLRFGTQIYPTTTAASQQYAAGIPINVGTVANPVFAYPTLSEQLGSSSTAAGDDLLLTDVVSFEVKVLQAGSSTPAFVSLWDTSIPTPTNTAITSFNVRVFDTWSSQTIGSYDYSGWATPSTDTSIPIQINILALQITIRVWDAKSQQTRQITIIQDV